MVRISKRGKTRRNTCDKMKLKDIVSNITSVKALVVAALAYSHSVSSLAFQNNNGIIPLLLSGVGRQDLYLFKHTQHSYASSDDDVVTSENGKSYGLGGTFPVWLHQYNQRDDTSIPTPVKISQLRNKMATISHLSEAEIERVLLGVRLAVDSIPASSSILFPTNLQGDTTLNGVVSFLLLLVEFMEMRTEALIGAAFHYCSCLQAIEDENRFENENVSLANGVGGSFDTVYLTPLASSRLSGFGPKTERIAIEAGRLRGAEGAAATILGRGKKNSENGTGSTRNAPLSVKNAEFAKNFRSLLLTTNAGGEWRSLAIRCAASLYRLQGLEGYRLNHLGPHVPPTRNEIGMAREALHIYSPLSHRLGMHRLKNELEEVAFRTLFRRQYKAVTSLLYDPIYGVRKNARGLPIYGRETSPFYFASFVDDDSPQNIGEGESISYGMQSVIEDVKSLVERILIEDTTLMEFISSLKVTARVKEPYSLWRKMLKIRQRKIELGEKSPVMSVLEVPDALALRVILQARKLTADEDNEVTARREQELCYYVRDLCIDNLPSTPYPSNGEDYNILGADIEKDYIKNSKKNGYQSLHYKSRIRFHGQKFPFEVQIRSLDMHRVAEVGVAAHWDYKDAYNATSNESMPNPLASESNTAKSITTEKDGDEQNDQLKVKDFEKFGFSSLASNNNELIEADNAFSILSHSLSQGDSWLNFEQNYRAENVRARAERLAPYINALSTAKMDLAREHVFVFFEQPSTGTSPSVGSIMSLPAHARVLDALKEKERKSGIKIKCLHTNQDEVKDYKDDIIILKNGVTATMFDRLENADILTYYLPAVARKVDQT